MPEPNGHYSQCIEHNRILYLSGQLPIDPATRKIHYTGEEQTSLTILKLKKFLMKPIVLKIKLYK